MIADLLLILSQLQCRMLILSQLPSSKFEYVQHLYSLDRYNGLNSLLYNNPVTVSCSSSGKRTSDWLKTGHVLQMVACNWIATGN